MDDDEDLTEFAIDVMFQATQPIGNAIHALAEAEMIVAAVDEHAPDTQAQLSQILRRVRSKTSTPRATHRSAFYLEIPMP